MLSGRARIEWWREIPSSAHPMPQQPSPECARSRARPVPFACEEFKRGLMMSIRFVLIAVAAAMLITGCRRRVYENPITKDTQQPDKVLFDKAIGDIEKSRFEIARLTLNTLMNTYDTSEYMAK